MPSLTRMSVAALLTLIPLMANAETLGPPSATIAADLQSGGSTEQSTIQLSVDIACGLTCPASAPALKAKIGGVTPFYASSSGESAGSTLFMTDDLLLRQQSTVTRDDVKPGATVVYRLTGAYCWCGNGSVDTRFSDAESNHTVVVPVRLFADQTGKVGTESTYSVSADLRGSEQLELTLSGAGVQQTRTFGAEGNRGISADISALPTSEGLMTLTAKLLPSGVTSTTQITVRPGDSNRQPVQNDSSDVGFTNDEPATGCSTGVVPFAGLVLLLLFRLRRW